MSEEILRCIDASEPPETFQLLLILADYYEESGEHIERCEGLRWLAANEKWPVNGSWKSESLGTDAPFRRLPHKVWRECWKMHGKWRNRNPYIRAADAYAAVKRRNHTKPIDTLERHHQAMETEPYVGEMPWNL